MLNVTITLTAEGSDQSTDGTITLVSGVNKFNIELSIPGYMTIVNALSLFEVGGQNTPLERVRISNIRPSPSGGDTIEYDVSSTPPGMFRVLDTFENAPVESFDIEVLDETSRPLTIEVQVRGCIEQVPTTTTAAPETTRPTTVTTTTSTTTVTTTPGVCEEDLDMLNVTITLTAEGSDQSTDGTITLVSGVNKFNIELSIPGYMTIVNALSLFEVGGQNTPLERVRISNIRPSPSGGDTIEYDVGSTPGMFRVLDTFENAPVESFDIEVLDETSRPLTIEVQVRGCIEQVPTTTTVAPETTTQSTTPVPPTTTASPETTTPSTTTVTTTTSTTTVTTTPGVCEEDLDMLNVTITLTAEGSDQSTDGTITLVSGVNKFNIELSIPGYMTIVNALSLFEAGGQNTPLERVRISNIRDRPSGGDTIEYDVSSTPPGMFRVLDTFGNAPVESFDIEVLDETSRPLTIEVQVRGCIEQVPATTTAAPETTTQSTTPVPTTTAAPETTTPSTTTVTTTTTTTTVTTTPGVCEEDLDMLNVTITLTAEGSDQSTDETITLVSGVNKFNIELSIPGYMTIVNALSLFEVGGQNTPLERVRISNIRPSPSGGDTIEYDVSSTPPGMFRVLDTFENAPVESFDIEVLDETSRPLTIEVQVRGCIEQVPTTTTAAPETTRPTTTVTTTTSTTTVTTTPGVCEEDLDMLNVTITLTAEGSDQSTDGTITLVSGVNKFNIELSIPGYMTIVNALSLFEVGGQNTPLERVRISNIRPSPSGGDTIEYNVSSTPPGMFRVLDTFENAPVESFDIEVLDEASRPLTIEVQVRGCIEQVPTTTTAAPETTRPTTTVTTTTTTTTVTTIPGVCEEDLDMLNVTITLTAEGSDQSTDGTITLVSGVNKFNIELSIPGYMTIVNALSLFEVGGQNTPLERVRISNIRPSPSGR
ncbi:mucin-22-like [Lytechinus variegatus]|uniref:mucin-22-like n=1 Tax=Lytechinus variegatus TaxID=7654 RepID=UPI001BB17327|nr:mucin-22-like [Lytechinus variegatus]